MKGRWPAKPGVLLLVLCLVCSAAFGEDENKTKRQSAYRKILAGAGLMAAGSLLVVHANNRCPAFCPPTSPSNAEATAGLGLLSSGVVGSIWGVISLHHANHSERLSTNRLALSDRSWKWYVAPVRSGARTGVYFRW